MVCQKVWFVSFGLFGVLGRFDGAERAGGALRRGGRCPWALQARTALGQQLCGLLRCPTAHSLLLHRAPSPPWAPRVPLSLWLFLGLLPPCLGESLLHRSLPSEAVWDPFMPGFGPSARIYGQLEPWQGLCWSGEQLRVPMAGWVLAQPLAAPPRPVGSSPAEREQGLCVPPGQALLELCIHPGHVFCSGFAVILATVLPAAGGMLTSHKVTLSTLLPTPKLLQSDVPPLPESSGHS